MAARSFIAVIVLLACAASGWARVRTGLDVLIADDFETIRGARVALITNHTAVTRRGRSIAEALAEAPNVTLVRILSPEHGFAGTAGAGEPVADGRDPATGVPVFSLYGETRRPTDAMLEGVDTMVFDIQDIGTRFYTYITTMGYGLEAAAARGLRYVVLDRPNPIRGDILEGDVLDADIRRFTGYYEIPVRHGLTVGELARWMNAERRLGADLTVIRMMGWRRSMWFEETGLPFRAPSPNIRSVQAALLYPGVGSFEATNVAVGRGTDRPFEIFGAPWLDAKRLCASLRRLNFPGAVFNEVTFTPEAGLYAGEPCHGVGVTITDRNAIRPFDIFVASFLAVYAAHPNAFKPDWEEVRVVTGSTRLERAARENRPLDGLLDEYAKTVRDFIGRISPFYLYN